MDNSVHRKDAANVTPPAYAAILLSTLVGPALGRSETAARLTPPCKACGGCTMRLELILRAPLAWTACAASPTGRPPAAVVRNASCGATTDGQSELAASSPCPRPWKCFLPLSNGADAAALGMGAEPDCKLPDGQKSAALTRRLGGASSWKTGVLCRRSPILPLAPLKTETAVAGPYSCRTRLCSGLANREGRRR